MLTCRSGRMVRSPPSARRPDPRQQTNNDLLPERWWIDPAQRPAGLEVRTLPPDPRFPWPLRSPLSTSAAGKTHSCSLTPTAVRTVSFQPLEASHPRTPPPLGTASAPQARRTVEPSEEEHPRHHSNLRNTHNFNSSSNTSSSSRNSRTAPDRLPQRREPRTSSGAPHWTITG